MGMINTIISMPGFLSPILVSYLTYENQTVHQWKIVFLITGAILIVSGIFFVLFSDSSIQEWNKYGMDSLSDEEKDEQVQLNNNVIEILPLETKSKLDNRLSSHT
jgi:MFS family permease